MVKETIKKIYLVFTFLVIFCFNNASGQDSKYSEKELIGKWKLIEIVLESDNSNSTINIPDNNEEAELSIKNDFIEFRSNRKGFDSTTQTYFSYKISDSLLYMGDRRYIIDILNGNSLVITEFDDITIITPVKYKYERLNK